MVKWTQQNKDSQGGKKSLAEWMADAKVLRQCIKSRCPVPLNFLLKKKKHSDKSILKAWECHSYLRSFSVVYWDKKWLNVKREFSKLKFFQRKHSRGNQPQKETQPQATSPQFLLPRPVSLKTLLRHYWLPAQKTPRTPLCHAPMLCELNSRKWDCISLGNDYLIVHQTPRLIYSVPNF